MSATLPRNRVMPSLFAATAILLTLSACTLIPEQEAPPGPIPDADRFDYWSQEIEWQRCAAAECATVKAPLDWDDPTAGQIELALLRHGAHVSDPVGTLFYNPGGPGVSGVDAVRDRYTSLFDIEVRREFDIVGFDPRGVGASTSIDCEASGERDRLIFGPWDSKPGTPAFEKEWEAASRAVVDRCIDNAGELLPFISTTQSAKDLELLRVLVGDSAVNFFGASYGSYLGATYASLFPETVGRMVLDSFPDYSRSADEGSLTRLAAFEAALTRLIKDCLPRSDCPFDTSVGDALDSIRSLLDRLDQEPLVSDDGRQLTGRLLLTGLQYGLYYESSWPEIRGALAAAQEGDPAPTLRVIDRFLGRGGGEYQSNYLDALLAYSCMDQRHTWTEDKIRTWRHAASEVAPTFARYQEIVDVCDGWPGRPASPPGPISVSGAGPIVIASSTGDTTTPHQWSVDLTDRIDSAVLLRRDGQGHGAYRMEDDCVDAAIDRYLAEGVTPAVGACG